MQAFTSARYTAPMGNHSYPMDKYRLVPERLLAEGILTPEEIVEPQPIALKDILRVHTPEYVHAFLNGTLERKALLRLGLPWSRQLVHRAFAVIGGTLGTARAALRDGIAANLAGGTHHAFADHGEGYCIFNDLVIVLRRLRAEGCIGCALVLDLDVHQGNGTAALCQTDPDTFTFSMHAAIITLPIKSTARGISPCRTARRTNSISVGWRRACPYSSNEPGRTWFCIRPVWTCSRATDSGK